MKKIILLFSVTIFFIPLFVTADPGYQALDFGDSTYNGNYCDNGDTNDGLPVYENSAGRLLYSSLSNDYWFLHTSIVTGFQDYDNPAGDTTINGPETGTWEYYQGTPPAGEVIYLSDCGVAEATTTPHEALTYEENLLIACVIIFMLSLMTWGFIFSPIKA